MARLAPYAKALVLVAAIVLVSIAQAVGVDLGLDVNELWTALGAAVLVFITPAPGYRAPTDAP